MSKPEYTTIVNAADMVLLHEYPDAIPGAQESSFIPWSTNWMIESNMSPSDPENTSLQYYNAQDNVFDVLTEHVVGSPLLAMVHNTDTIVLVGWSGILNQGVIETSDWRAEFSENPMRAWIEDDMLVILSVDQFLIKYHMVTTTIFFRSCTSLTKYL